MEVNCGKLSNSERTRVKRKKIFILLTIILFIIPDLSHHIPYFILLLDHLAHLHEQSSWHIRASLHHVLPHHQAQLWVGLKHQRTLLSSMSIQDPSLLWILWVTRRAVHWRTRIHGPGPGGYTSTNCILRQWLRTLDCLHLNKKIEINWLLNFDMLVFIIWYLAKDIYI